ncbi:GAF domain-containing protein [Azohydromonas aeria]|uniref:GAF domain-containing protein n=1 Tax=Azohydromonas aeria TaxID=2590212 RepID=UPI0012FBED97|nr:GAF domain-containing protein [Azohydromonas aeria]
MLPAPIPVDESERLAALRELLILDTPPEERFDRIVNFAAAEFDCPIALISLVDSRRQWFKARVGLEACETSRDISFCGHAIAQDGLFMVEDARQDERFVDNPLVLNAPHIRFYAGAPLRCGAGSHIGTLCLIDTRPRRLDSIDQCILTALRQLVEDELKRALQQP